MKINLLLINFFKSKFLLKYFVSYKNIYFYFCRKSQDIPEPQPTPKNFGSGFRLGSSRDAPVMPVRDSVPDVAQNTNITITFWRQGFVVDDGPLRRYDENANAAFLKDIDDG